MNLIDLYDVLPPELEPALEHEMRAQALEAQAQQVREDGVWPITDAVGEMWADEDGILRQDDRIEGYPVAAAQMVTRAAASRMITGARLARRD